MRTDQMISTIQHTAIVKIK